jgi:methionyl-tRNA synthetase
MATTYGMDMSFSELSLVMMHNSELADILGNLVHRGLNLCLKFCKGVIPDTPHDAGFPMPFDVSELRAGVLEDMKDNKNAIHAAMFRAIDAVRATNRYLTAAEPWKMKGEDESRKPAIVRTTLEAIYVFTHFLAPVLPLAAEKIFTRLNTPPKSVHNLKTDFYNLVPGTPVTLGDILFTKLGENGEEEGSAKGGGSGKAKGMTAEEQKAAKDAKKAKNAKSAADQQQKKAEKKSSAAASSKAAKVSETAEEQHDFTKIELRVGQITKVWNHETGDKLYCEEIEMGEEAPRQIASGLRAHYTLEEMQGRRLIVVCNLKKASLMGFSSSGMVLCAKSEDGKVEFVTPPAEAAIGERIVLEGVPDCPPYSASQVKKYKVWEKVIAPHLRTDADGIATWQGIPLVTSSSAGKLTVTSAVSSPIS